jgi:hypothetical protein
LSTDRPEFPEYPLRDPDTAHRPIGDDGGLVVVPSEATVQVLNPVGSKVFSMLDGKHSHDEIVAAVVDEYDVTEAVARKDLEDFLAGLKAKGMLADAGKNEADHE